jgi:hypothetical protein
VHNRADTIPDILADHAANTRAHLFTDSVADKYTNHVPNVESHRIAHRIANARTDAGADATLRVRFSRTVVQHHVGMGCRV